MTKELQQRMGKMGYNNLIEWCKIMEFRSAGRMKLTEKVHDSICLTEMAVDYILSVVRETGVMEYIGERRGKIIYCQLKDYRGNTLKKC
jgi:hypothetical protein